MAGLHVYLISSLPGLAFGVKPPFSYPDFLALCRRLIPEKEVRVLAGIPNIIESGYEYEGSEVTLKAWCDFETLLANELVKVRASRKKVEAEKYLRRPAYVPVWVTHLALAAQRSTSLLEGEKVLDKERWNYLDEFSRGHYFDLDFLIIYALKLLILWRWESIDNRDKDKLLEEVFEVKHDDKA